MQKCQIRRVKGYLQEHDRQVMVHVDTHEPYQHVLRIESSRGESIRNIMWIMALNYRAQKWDLNHVTVPR